MIRIVLDTNVLVAGLLSEKGPPGQIVDSILAGEIEVACDTRILAEYRDVLARPKLLIDQKEAEHVLQQIQHSACWCRLGRGRSRSQMPTMKLFSPWPKHRTRSVWSPATLNIFPPACVAMYGF